MHRLRPWLELMRLSNLPTVVGNCMSGAAAALAAGTSGGASVLAEPMLWWAVLAVALCYIGGMALNDVADARRDAAAGRARPIPAGHIRRGHALVFALTCLAAGPALLGLTGPTEAMGAAIALVALIVGYDLLHGRWAGAVVLMGLCRAAVYVVAAAAVAPGAWWNEPRALAAIAGLVALYTTAITVVARMEDRSGLDARRWLALAMALLPLGALAVAQPRQHLAVALVAGGLMLAWLGRSARFVLMRPPRTREAVMGWLAGMCLVDAFFLAIMDQPAAAAVAVGCFVLTTLAHRRISGT